MGPVVGSKVIEVARGLVGCHYINGAYGATPDRNDGCPCRPGGVKLVATPSRLNPAKAATPNQDLAVFAAEMQIKEYCVCAGNYTSPPVGRVASATDSDVVAYLESLKGKPPAEWPVPPNGLTPRRAFGPGIGAGGKLLWGKSCQGVRHFDCVGFISYCYWKATGNVVQLDIKAWRNPAMGGTVFNFQEEVVKDAATNATTTRPPKLPAGLMDGDIIIKADHHIAFVTAQGAIYEAQDSHIGVTGSGRFSLGASGDWSHLVRLGGSAVTPDPDWPLGWWKVWDTNTYFYFFAADGTVQSTKTSPPNTRTPPKHANNVGRYTLTPPNRLVITWNKVAGAAESCRETFSNAASGCQQMNATSNLYGPLVATRMG